MKRTGNIIGIVLFFVAATAALGQEGMAPEFRLLGVAGNDLVLDVRDARAVSAAPLTLDPVVPPPPRMAPELALLTYLGHARRQLADLGAYTDTTTVEAELPKSSQHGKFELRRSYKAPSSLAFAAIRFVGDGFIKTNVIARLLQSEVEHTQKGEGARTAITADNYKFSYKGTEDGDGRLAYVYQVKPRRKQPGLFKGRIVLDAASGRLRRAEGAMVKTPSLFVKKIEFVQDYADFGPFSLPVHVHSVAKTRFVGRAVVDIYHQHYNARTVADVQAEDRTAAAAGDSAGRN